MASKEPSEMDLFVNAQLIHKGHSSYPAPQRKPDQYEQVASQMSDKQISEMKIINRGHLGVPEEILKAGAAQYASMCGYINNLNVLKQTVSVVHLFVVALRLLGIPVPLPS